MILERFALTAEGSRESAFRCYMDNARHRGTRCIVLGGFEDWDLTKHYGGVHALEGTNFELRSGEHVAIMGDNGAGKSTFVRQITGVGRTSHPRKGLVKR